MKQSELRTEAVQGYCEVSKRSDSQFIKAYFSETVINKRREIDEAE